MINEFISTILQFAAAAATAAAAVVMRLQGCSCSSSILLINSECQTIPVYKIW